MKLLIILTIIWVVSFIWMIYAFITAPTYPPEYDDREYKVYLELLNKLHKNKKEP